MQAIPESNAGPQWNSKLLDDLVFIKKHLRYPFSKRTLPSLLLLTTFLAFFIRMVWITFIIRKNAPAYIWVIVILLLIASLLNVIYRYYAVIKFKTIATPFFMDENRKLIQKFLTSQQLVVYTHPKAPEAFQILSRPLGNIENGQREVMIFIADDKRILVNSHFVNEKFTLSLPSGNSGSMANRLKEWIKVQYPNTNTSVMR